MHSLEVYFLWATVAVQHGGSVEVDLWPMQMQRAELMEPQFIV